MGRLPSRRRLRILVACPDRHLTYDGTTPDQVGVGGGVTARLRLASALAARGHRVTLAGNVTGGVRTAGVHYLPFEAAAGWRGDVLVAQSSGGAMDVTPVRELAVQAGTTLLWCQGFVPVQGVQLLDPAVVVGCSNFVRDVLEGDWGIAPDRLAVVYNGVEDRYLARRHWVVRRDHRRLVWTSHPSKGVTAATGLLQRLRQYDRRYTLHLFGGAALWGQLAAGPPTGPGIVDHGLVGQRELHRALLQAGVAVHIQGFREPFGISLAQARAAGALAVCSAIGAFPELVRHGEDGLLVTGAHDDPATLDRAAELVHAVVSQPALYHTITRRSLARPLPWRTLAEVWEELALWLLAGRPARRLLAGSPSCPACGGGRLALADGYHCSGCGRYTEGLG